jgi:N-methylhydantoinase B
VDDDGHEDRPVPIRVTVTIRGDRATFDFTGTGPSVKGPVNTTPFVACSAVYYSLKSLVAPDVPGNDGSYRPIAVNVPPGTILNPPRDAPVVGGNHETSQRVVDACYKALATAIPERITAGGPTTSGLLLFGTRRDGRWHILYEVHGGGEGAGAHRDGGHAVRVHMSNVMNTPTEVIETEYPMEVLEHALRPGSGGAGRHRGGCGLRRAYRVLAATTLTTMLERRVIPPWGIFGGADGLPYRIMLERGGGRREIKGKETVALEPGDVVLIETSGGGGYGDTAARPAALLAQDRREGYGPDAAGPPSVAGAPAERKSAR